MSDPACAKREMRLAHTAARKRRAADPEAKRALDEAIVAHTLACIAHFEATGRGIAAYNPLSTEPGPADFAAQLAPHVSAVWLPISLPDGVLEWAQHKPSDLDHASRGPFGISEPDGPRRGSEVLAGLGLVVAPALGVDTQHMRLGKGGGYYDRALAGLDTPVAAVVYDEEFVQHVPHEAHDVPVNAVITPSGFFVP